MPKLKEIFFNKNVIIYFTILLFLVLRISKIFFHSIFLKQKFK